MTTARLSHCARLLAALIVVLASMTELSHQQQLTQQQIPGVQGIQGSGVIPPGQQIAGTLPQNIYAFLKSNQATSRFASILDQISQQYNDPTLINILSSDNPQANAASLGSNGFTVFAPVNEALNNLPTNPDSFRNGIYNMVVRDRISLETLRTLNGQNISRTFGYWPKLNVRVVKSFFLNQLAKAKKYGGAAGDYRTGTGSYQQNMPFQASGFNANNNYPQQQQQQQQQNWGNNNMNNMNNNYNNMNNNYNNNNNYQQGMNPMYPPRNVDNNNMTGGQENMRHDGPPRQDGPPSLKIPRQVYPNQQFPASTPTYPPNLTTSPTWNPNNPFPQAQYPQGQYPDQSLLGQSFSGYNDPNSNMNVYDQYMSMYGNQQQINGLPASPRIPLDEIFLINNAVILDKFELTNGVVYIISSYPRYYEKSILQLLSNNDVNGLATNLNFWITRAAQSYRTGDENLKNALNAFGPNTYFLPIDQAFNKFNDRDSLNNNSFLFDLFRTHRINDRILFSYYFDDPSVVAYTDTGLPVSSRHVRNNGQDEIEISIGHVKGRLLNEYSNIYCASGVVHLVDTVLGVPARNAYQELSSIPELSQFKQLVDRSPRFRQLLDTQNTVIGQYPNRNQYMGGQPRLQRQPTTPAINGQVNETMPTGATGMNNQPTNGEPMMPTAPSTASTSGIKKRSRRQDILNANLNPAHNPGQAQLAGQTGISALLNPQSDPNNYMAVNINQIPPNTNLNAFNQGSNSPTGYYPFGQSNVQQYTILAPSNTAFLGLMDDILNNASAIESIISAHIIVDNSNRAFFTDHDDSIFQNGQVYATLNPGVPLVASVTPEVSSAGNRVSLQIQNMPNLVTTITNGNDRVSNGVIHVVDKILSQGSATDIATLLERYSMSNNPGAPAFSQFVDALRVTGIFNDLRDPSRKYTLFIPTNEALAQYQDILMSTDLDKKRQLIYRHMCLDQNLQSTYLSAVAGGAGGVGSNWNPTYNQQGQVNTAINQQSPIGPATNPSFNPQPLGGANTPPILPNNPPFNQQNSPQYNQPYYNQGNQLICRNALGQDLTLSKDSYGLISKFQGQASAKVITDFPGIYSSAYVLEKPLLNQNLPNYGLNYVNAAPTRLCLSSLLSTLLLLAALVLLN